MWNLISDLIALKENSVEFFLSRIWLFDALKIRQEIIPKRLLNKGIKKPRLKFNIGLALNGLRTTGPRSLYLNSRILTIICKCISVTSKKIYPPKLLLWKYQLCLPGYNATSISLSRFNCYKKEKKDISPCCSV